MAAGTTYEQIATTTLSSATASITFSSISGNYTDLILVFNGKMASGVGADTMALRFNSDTATNYSATRLSGNGSTASSGRWSTVDMGYTGVIDETQSVVIVSINDYSNTTTYKSALSRSNDAAYGVYANVILWRSTNAINTILIRTYGNNNFASGSVATLYGIASA